MAQPIVLDRKVQDEDRRVRPCDTMFTKTRLLRPDRQLIVPAGTVPIDVTRFFLQTSTSLCVHDSFVDCFNLRGRERADSALKHSYIASHLQVSACDCSIRSELPKEPLLTLKDIAFCIAAHQRGESNLLLDNDSLHIFYVKRENGEACGVIVKCFSNIYRRCLVYEWQLVAQGMWRPGLQVICPGTAVL